MLYDKFTSRYYLYGNYHRDCIAVAKCHCVGDDESAWTVTNGIGIYSSADLESWRYEAGPVLAPYNQPRVVGPVPTPGGGGHEYRMYLQFPLRLATGMHAAGPFVLQPDVVQMDTPTHDMNVMLDAHTGRTFMIYSDASVGYRIRVQELSSDGRSGQPGASSMPFGPKPCEAPVLFQGRRGRFYAIFGHNCWCCADGAEAFVFSASDPLGLWRSHGNINRGADGARLVRGQTAFAQRLVPPGGGGEEDEPFIFLAFDRWMTGSSRASMLQHWAPLSLGANASAAGDGGVQVPRLSTVANWSLSSSLTLAMSSTYADDHATDRGGATGAVECVDSWALAYPTEQHDWHGRSCPYKRRWGQCQTFGRVCARTCGVCAQPALPPAELPPTLSPAPPPTPLPSPLRQNAAPHQPSPQRTQSPAYPSAWPVSDPVTLSLDALPSGSVRGYGNGQSGGSASDPEVLMLGWWTSMFSIVALMSMLTAIARGSPPVPVPRA